MWPYSLALNAGQVEQPPGGDHLPLVVVLIGEINHLTDTWTQGGGKKKSLSHCQIFYMVVRAMYAAVLMRALVSQQRISASTSIHFSSDPGLIHFVRRR